MLPMQYPEQIDPQTDDERYMLEALREAWQAFRGGEVPVGAVLVQEGRVIARGHNQVEMLHDATAHAEMLCITAGASAIDNWRLANTTLYCTVEPCSMCAGAMLLSRLPRLVWGAPDLRHGANGSWVNLFEKEHPTHAIEITTGVLEEYSARLMREFFRQRREENRKEKESS
ncbi:tRNA-specific adenosine deaminase [Chlamydiales bacterium SCGC AG-110-P3]|nr:tRNA-specific adenosine deaminase [Chlamydiales bacterium SCGC AG-110-P3]